MHKLVGCAATRTWIVALGMVVGLVVQPADSAVLAMSTFDNDDEGLLFWDGPEPVVLAAPGYFDSGGNPGGYIEIADAADPNFFVVASSAFTGVDSSGLDNVVLSSIPIARALLTGALGAPGLAVRGRVVVSL
jgi:hypothetical protein